MGPPRAEAGARALTARRLIALGGLALAAAGCASVNPAELQQRGTDGDAEECRRGDGEQAIAACRRVVGRPPLNPLLTTPEVRTVVYALRSLHASVLGQRLLRAGRPEETLAAADIALDIAERFHRIGPLGVARADAEMARAYALQRASAHTLAATAFLRLRRWQDATARLREAVQGAPDKALLWGTLGVAANQAGDFEESSAAFARAEALDPAYFTGGRRGQRDIWRASQQGRRFEMAAFEEELLL